MSGNHIRVEGSGIRDQERGRSRFTAGPGVPVGIDERPAREHSRGEPYARAP